MSIPYRCRGCGVVFPFRPMIVDGREARVIHLCAGGTTAPADREEIEEDPISWLRRMTADAPTEPDTDTPPNDAE